MLGLAVCVWGGLVGFCEVVALCGIGREIWLVVGLLWLRRRLPTREAGL